MTIALTNAVVRHPQRVTLLFSEALDPSAFTSTVYYSFTSLDGVGAPPSVIAAISITGAANSVDLALDTPLADGAAFAVYAEGVIGADTTSTPPGTNLPIYQGVAPEDSNVEVTTVDVDALVFGTDLVWTGTDFLEGTSGDLAISSGLAVYQADMMRRLTSPTSLLWDPTWGLQGADFVNSPRARSTTMKGALIRQALADDRTGKVTVDVRFNPSDPTSVYFTVNVQPRAAPDTGPIPITISFPV